jgi:NACalpha-BTF3-like transcription factor
MSNNIFETKLNKLNTFIDNFNSDTFKNIKLLFNEYNLLIEKYYLTEYTIIFNLINKFETTISKDIDNIIKYYNDKDVSNILKYRDDKNNYDNEEIDYTSLNNFTDMIKILGNKLIEQINKIKKQELIMEGIDIMKKQININTELATQLLVENNYDPVDAILAFMNYKDKQEDNTFFSIQLNQHELVNELVNISENLSTEFNNNLSSKLLNKIKSYVCVLINDKNDIRKIKKYSSITELYELYIDKNIETYNSIKINIAGLDYGILINKNNIKNKDSLNTNDFVNMPITMILRNLNLVNSTDLYISSALFINNFFLN